MQSFIIKPNFTLLFSHTKFVSLINYYSENDEANSYNVCTSSEYINIRSSYDLSYNVSLNN